MKGTEKMEPVQENTAEIVNVAVDAWNKGKCPIILGNGEFRKPSRTSGSLAKSYSLEPA